MTENTSEHIYKPLPQRLTILPSSIHGLGLFTKPELDRDYPVYITGEFIGVTHINSALIPTDKIKILLSDIEIPKDDVFPNGLIRTPLGGWINHSENSNIDFHYLGDGCWGITAARDIYPGEEIVINYKYTPCGVIKT